MIDPTINNYLNGKIYKLVSSQTSNIYIGSTTQPLALRLREHLTGYNGKGDYTSANKILQYGDVTIELIEEYPTTSAFYLELKEAHWIKQLDCVNERIPRSNYQYVEGVEIIDPTFDKYKEGKIYKLTSNHTTDIYIGSTSKELKERLVYIYQVIKLT
jgi:predicted GIY-YIG superfamily endonuclease